jgi:methylenetetrahydrofolate dehydrogenase (NADP+)/methenyltetrahydrofolate cyclohydrolase
MAIIFEAAPRQKALKEALMRQCKARAKKSCVPTLAAIRVGGDEASGVYIANQRKLAYALGVRHVCVEYGAGVTQAAIVKKIKALNNDPAIHGIFIATPLPKHIRYESLIEQVACEKDVEGLHPANLGKLFLNTPPLIVPPTAAAVMEILRSRKVPLRGKEVAIVGHSERVGKPLCLLLLKELATVSVCHIGTFQNGTLKDHTRKAQILVVAVGKPRFIKKDFVRKNALVIDVGINKVEGSIVGDVDFASVRKVASFITPVPGGVGLFTNVMLMKNLLILYDALFTRKRRA